MNIVLESFRGFTWFIHKVFRVFYLLAHGTSFSDLRSRWHHEKEEIARRRQMKREARLDAKWNVYKIRKKMVFYKLDRHLVMQLFPDDEFSRTVFIRSFEPDERAFVKKYLRRGDVFVDVGANIGMFTLIAARVVNPQGHVYSFEPCSTTFVRLNDNLKLNNIKNVDCFPIALSNVNETRRLVTSLDGFGAWNSLAHPTQGKLLGEEMVICKPWDVFSEEHNLHGKVALMKIDVEGWETNVLIGAIRTLSLDSAPDLLVEFTDVNAIAAGTSCVDLYLRLESLGYKMFHIDAKRHLFYQASTKDSFEYVNLLATKHLADVCNRTKFKVA